MDNIPVKRGRKPKSVEQPPVSNETEVKAEVKAEVKMEVKVEVKVEADVDVKASKSKTKSKVKTAVDTVEVNMDTVVSPKPSKPTKTHKKKINPVVELTIQPSIDNIITDTVDNIQTIMDNISIDNVITNASENNTQENKLPEDDTNEIVEDVKSCIKKRGRKPKGGKIVQQATPLNNNTEPRPNVILHLKCAIKDLHNPTTQRNSSNNIPIESFNIAATKHELSYEIINFNQSINSACLSYSCVKHFVILKGK